MREKFLRGIDLIKKTWRTWLPFLVVIPLVYIWYRNNHILPLQDSIQKLGFCLCLVLLFDAIIYHTQESRLWLFLQYAFKFLTICFATVLLHRIYPYYANSLMIQTIKSHLPKLDTAMASILSSLTAILVFEKILEWMTKVICPEWNVFTIAELRIHKTPCVILATVYSLYFALYFDFEQQYIEVQSFIGLMAVFVIIYAVYWVKYPYAKQRYVEKKIAQYIDRSAALPHNLELMGLKYYHPQITEPSTSPLVQKTCKEIIRKMELLTSSVESLSSFEKVAEVIALLLKPYKKTKIDRITKKKRNRDKKDRLLAPLRLVWLSIGLGSMTQELYRYKEDGEAIISIVKDMRDILEKKVSTEMAYYFALGVYSRIIKENMYAGIINQIEKELDQNPGSEGTPTEYNGYVRLLKRKMGRKIAKESSDKDYKAIEALFLWR